MKFLTQILVAKRWTLLGYQGFTLSYSLVVDTNPNDPNAFGLVGLVFNTPFVYMMECQLLDPGALNRWGHNLARAPFSTVDTRPAHPPPLFLVLSPRHL